MSGPTLNLRSPPDFRTLRRGTKSSSGTRGLQPSHASGWTRARCRNLHQHRSLEEIRVLRREDRSAYPARQPVLGPHVASVRESGVLSRRRQRKGRLEAGPLPCRQLMRSSLPTRRHCATPRPRLPEPLQQSNRGTTRSGSTGRQPETPNGSGPTNGCGREDRSLAALDASAAVPPFQAVIEDRRASPVAGAPGQAHPTDCRQ